MQRPQAGGVVATAGGHSSDCSPVTVGRSEEYSRWPFGSMKQRDTDHVAGSSARGLSV